MKKTKTHVVLAFHKLYGLCENASFVIPQAFCYGDPLKGVGRDEWWELSEEYPGWACGWACGCANKNNLINNKPPSHSLPALQAMVNERTQRYSRFSGLQLEQFEMNEVVCLYCGKFLHSKISNQRITCFYKNLGPRARKILCQIVKEQSVHILGRVPIYLHYWIHWHHGTNIHLKLKHQIVWKHGHEIHPMRVLFTQWQHKRSIRSFWLQKCDGFHQIHPVTPLASVFCPIFGRKYDFFLLWTYSIPSRELTYPTLGSLEHHRLKSAKRSGIC